MDSKLKCVFMLPENSAGGGTSTLGGIANGASTNAGVTIIENNKPEFYQTASSSAIPMKPQSSPKVLT